jgi:hypothetical protein
MATSDTPSLFDQLPAPVVARFQRYHRANPHVYDLFRRFAREAMAAGRVRYSADAILHRIRWFVQVETAGEFKANNDAAAFYARMLIAEDAAFSGFFQLRKSAADLHRETPESG